jgi:prophage tail gpP-like protein
MRNEGLVKTMIAGAAVAAHRLVKFDGTTAAQVIQATAASSVTIGVSDLGADAAADMLDVIIDGIATVEAGGTIAQGDPVTSDANGKAVVAAPAATVTARIIGFAMEGAVSGDLFGVRIAPGYVTNGANS